MLYSSRGKILYPFPIRHIMPEPVGAEDKYGFPADMSLIKIRLQFFPGPYALQDHIPSGIGNRLAFGKPSVLNLPLDQGLIPCKLPRLLVDTVNTAVPHLADKILLLPYKEKAQRRPAGYAPAPVLIIDPLVHVCNKGLDPEP